MLPFLSIWDVRPGGPLPEKRPFQDGLFSGDEFLKLLNLVELSGEGLLSDREQLRMGKLSIEMKGFRDLVTSADRNSEETLISGIQTLFPEDAIYSEESGEARATGSRRWILDPLDGTTNFAHGHPLFAVSAGLVDSEGPIAAVIHAPVLRETWWATRGGGAWVRRVSSSSNDVAAPRPLHMATPVDLASSLLATGFSYRRREVDHGAVDLFEDLLLKAREIRRGGSACLDLAFTASGIFAGFWEFELAPHDVAAGALLVREAGGVVTDGEGGDDWLFGKSIIASAPSLHEELLKRVAPVTTALKKNSGSS